MPWVRVMQGYGWSVRAADKYVAVKYCMVYQGVITPLPDRSLRRFGERRGTVFFLETAGQSC